MSSDLLSDSIEKELHEFVLLSWPERKEWLLAREHLRSDDTLTRLRAKQARQRSKSGADVIAEIIAVIEACQSDGLDVALRGERFEWPTDPRDKLHKLIQSFLRSTWDERRALLATEPQLMSDEVLAMVLEGSRESDDPRVLEIVKSLYDLLLRCREVGPDFATREAENLLASAIAAERAEGSITTRVSVSGAPAESVARATPIGATELDPVAAQLTVADGRMSFEEIDRPLTMLVMGATSCYVVQW